MHKLNAEYADNDCGTIIKGRDPYLIINIEKYCKINRISPSHCDIVYVTFKDDKCRIYLVEFKNIEEFNEELEKEFKNTKESKFWSKIRNKFDQTLNLVKNCIADILKVKIERCECYGVLVLPIDIIDKINEISSIFKRNRIIIGGLKELKDAWITACGDEIYNKHINLK